MFPYIGNVIIPTDFHSIIFQRGGEKPPTSYDWYFIFDPLKRLKLLLRIKLIKPARLHLAVASEHLEVVELLLQRGANVNR